SLAVELFGNGLLLFQLFELLSHVHELLEHCLRRGMLARECFQLLNQLPVFAHLIPMPAPASDEHGRDNRRPLHRPFAEDLLSSERLRQQVDCLSHAALQTSDDNATAPPSTAARFPAAHGIGAVSSDCNVQICTGNESALAR